MKYHRFCWDESPGGESASWGASTWYTEIDSEGLPSRQIEIYQNGHILKYGPEHLLDEYGFLADQKTESIAGLEEISADEFEQLWKNLKALNQP